jgi:hypothetical protein
VEGAALAPGPRSPRPARGPLALPFGHDKLETARAAAAADLGELGGELAALEDAASPGSSLAGEFLAATESFQAAETALDQARDPEELGAVTAAIAAGRLLTATMHAVLDRDRRPTASTPCLFDPAHGPASQYIVWTPPFAGDPRAVPVCAPDAETIERDEQPQPRSVVAGHHVRPYWELPELAAWYLGYFRAEDGCDPVALVAGTPLGDELVSRVPADADDGVITSEELFRRRERDDG